MKLIYVWIEQFRNIVGQGFAVDDEIIVNINASDNANFMYYTIDNNPILFSGFETQCGQKIFERSLTISINKSYKSKAYLEATGFEPATSASRTQRSTKLSHASIKTHMLKSM